VVRISHGPYPWRLAMKALKKAASTAMNPTTYASQF